jgi:hypothetical protein
MIFIHQYNDTHGLETISQVSDLLRTFAAYFTFQ